MPSNYLVNQIKISPKAARVNANISQKEAAKRFGIDVSTLRRYENCQSVPPWDIANAMEREYGINKDNIFFKATTALSDKSEVG